MNYFLTLQTIMEAFVGFTVNFISTIGSDFNSMYIIYSLDAYKQEDRSENVKLRIVCHIP